MVFIIINKKSNHQPYQDMLQEQVHCYLRKHLDIIRHTYIKRIHYADSMNRSSNLLSSYIIRCKALAYGLEEAIIGEKSVKDFLNLIKGRGPFKLCQSEYN